MPPSLPILDAIAATLKGHPEIARVELQGHADSRESSSLGERRAAAVADYLAKRGVDPARLAVQGYGSKRPIARERDESDRAKNRRVELVILDRAK